MPRKQSIVPYREKENVLNANISRPKTKAFDSLQQSSVFADALTHANRQGLDEAELAKSLRLLMALPEE